LTWYGVIGNRDYRNKGLKKEYLVYKNGWIIDDFFWHHQMSVDKDYRVAFVHIDTSFLAYGKGGEPGNKRMKKYFEKYQWTDAEVLKRIEWHLEENKDAHYKIAVGHHPIGHVAGEGKHSLNKV